MGGSFRSSRSERYGEQFLRSAVPLLLAERFEELRESVPGYGRSAAGPRGAD